MICFNRRHAKSHLDCILDNSFIRSLIVRRWVDIFVLTSISMIIWCIFSKELEAYLGWIYDFETKLPRLVYFTFLVIIVVMIFLLLTRLGAIHPLYRIKTIFHYPPCWIASLLGFFIIIIITIPFQIIKEVAINSNFHNISFYYLPILLGINLSLLITFLSENNSTRKRREEFNIKPKNELIRGRVHEINHYSAQIEPEQVLYLKPEWIKNECPIEGENEDLLGHRYIAQRIARLILNRQPSNIGLIGGFGCGKSGILNLVSEYLKNTDKLYSGNNHIHEFTTIICKVDGWGRSTESISQIILQLIVNEMKSHFDCVSIITLPEDYRKALMGANSAISSLLYAIINKGNNPLDQLLRIDQILEATQHKLLVNIEDIDRHTTNVETFKNEISGLLDRLRNLKNVSFILAIGTEYRYSEILVRLCDHHEAVPAQQDLVKIIENFRNNCLSQYNDITLFPKVDLSQELVSYSTSHESTEYISPIEAISALSNSPRILKQIFRKTMVTWDCLHGEINFDDLLIINAIRFSSPSLFDYLIEKIEVIKSINRFTEREETRTRIDKIRNEILTLCDSSGLNTQLLLGIFSYLFQSFSYANHERRPQSIGFWSSETNYWNRFILERIEGIPDQEVLKEILNWKKIGKTANLPKRIIENNSFARKFKELSPGFFSGEQIRELVSHCFEYIIKSNISFCEFNNPGSDALKELEVIVANTPISDEMFDRRWLLNEIELSLKYSLTFSNEIYQRFRMNYIQARRRPNQNFDEIKKEINEIAKESYSNPQVLVSALSKSGPWSVFHFTKYFSSKNAGCSGFNPIEWAWFGKSLMDASNIRPHLVQKHLLLMLVRFQANYDNTSTYHFDGNCIPDMFGKYQIDLIKLLINDYGNIDQKPLIGAFVVAQEAAKRAKETEPDYIWPTLPPITIKDQI